MNAQGAARSVPGVRRYHFHLPGVVYILATLLIAVGAINSQNNLLFAALGLAVGGLLVSGVISGAALMGLRMEREPVGAGEVGAPLTVAYVLTNANRLFPAFGLNIVELPAGEGGWQERIGPVRAFCMHVGARQSVRVEARALPHRRGPAEFREVRVWTTFPFGLTRKSVTFTVPGTAIIRPLRLTLRPDVLARLSAQAPLGTGAERQTGSGDEFFGLREYTPGDSQRRIAWRRSARTGELIVRQQAASSPLQVWVVVDPAGMDGASRERGVALAAAVVRAGAAEGMAVGLATPRAARRPGVGHRHTEALITDLAVLGAEGALRLPPGLGRKGAVVAIGSEGPPGAVRLFEGGLESLITGADPRLLALLDPGPKGGEAR